MYGEKYKRLVENDMVDFWLKTLKLKRISETFGFCQHELNFKA